MIESYVLVSTDTNNLEIIDGPLLWDGETELTLADNTMMILESYALDNGYSYPVPEVSPLDEIMASLTAALGFNHVYLSTADSDQVAALTRQVNALIRLATGQTDDSSDT